MTKNRCKKVAPKSNKQPLKVGYARVSTADQNPDMQVQALKDYGVHPDLIFVDHASGTTMDRPQFLRALRMCQAPGAEFVVWKMDRVGRTLKGVLQFLDMLAERDVHLVSLTDAVDTRGPMGPMGKAMVHLMAVVAELERDLIVERTRAGMKRVKERGSKAGRPPTMTPARVKRAQELLAEGKRGPSVWNEIKLIDADQRKISLAAYYLWQKEFDRTVVNGGDENDT